MQSARIERKYCASVYHVSSLLVEVRMFLRRIGSSGRENGKTYKRQGPGRFEIFAFIPVGRPADTRYIVLSTSKKQYPFGTFLILIFAILKFSHIFSTVVLRDFYVPFFTTGKAKELYMFHSKIHIENNLCTFDVVGMLGPKHACRV